MRALYIILPILCVLAIAYRYYSAFIAAQVMVARRLADDAGARAGTTATTTIRPPAGSCSATISPRSPAPGPLIGPVLAAQFGYRPGCSGWSRVSAWRRRARLHHPVGLDAARRRIAGRDRPRRDRARWPASPRPSRSCSSSSSRWPASASRSSTRSRRAPGARSPSASRSRSRSSWASTCTGSGRARSRSDGHRRGRPVPRGRSSASRSPRSSFGALVSPAREQLIVAMASYGFVASVLPVWMLLCPRDYLSSFMKIGTIAFLVVGVIVVNPELKMPAFSQFVDGGGPIVPGRSSRSSSSPSPAARSRASTRWSRSARRRR